MLNALSLLALLLTSNPGPMDEVCELPNVFPGRSTTRDCMGCHDGTIGPLANVTFPGTPEGAPSTLEGFEHAEGSDRAHPVDMDYEASALHRPGSLTPPAALPVELALTDGRVTCVTCHHPDSGEKYRVALSLDASALCRACHLN